VWPAGRTSRSKLTDVEGAPPETPSDSPLTMEQALASPVYRDLMTPKLAVGDPAFPFDLPRLDGGERVRLAAFAGRRPVALVFGSYT
jgi:hypothetical protein